MSNYSVSLKGIGIENFKAFGEYQHFDLAPITIITGPNNSGKSALVAALELLSKNDIYSHLDFHSNGLEIGDSSQVVNSNTGLKQIIFELDFKLIPPQKFTKNIIL
jgi:AAA15 family ATPase/GTPase